MQWFTRGCLDIIGLRVYGWKEKKLRIGKVNGAGQGMEGGAQGKGFWYIAVV